MKYILAIAIMALLVLTACSSEEVQITDAESTGGDTTPSDTGDVVDGVTEEAGDSIEGADDTIDDLNLDDW